MERDNRKSVMRSSTSLNGLLGIHFFFLKRILIETEDLKIRTELGFLGNYSICTVSSEHNKKENTVKWIYENNIINNNIIKFTL